MLRRLTLGAFVLVVCGLASAQLGRADSPPGGAKRASVTGDIADLQRGCPYTISVYPAQHVDHHRRGPLHLNRQIRKGFDRYVVKSTNPKRVICELLVLRTVKKKSFLRRLSKYRQGEFAWVDRHPRRQDKLTYVSAFAHE